MEWVDRVIYKMYKLVSATNTRTQRQAFTIVELLIVIVVIAVLAGISIVAFTGTQQRARDMSRTSAVTQIRKALEAYRAEHGTYPPVRSIGTNIPAGFVGQWGIGYEYSVDTRGNWLKSLVDSKVTSSLPMDPINDSSHYFVYWTSGSIGSCQEPVYILAVVGYENSSNIPKDSKSLNCSSAGTTAHWTTAADRAVFSNIAR